MALHPSIYVEMINLAGATARRETMAPVLQAAGMSPTVLPAVDYRDDPDNQVDTLSKPQGRWGVFKEQDRAVTISHSKVWERFLATEHDLCLVIEDDIFIAPDLAHWLSDLAWWPEDADCVKLERWRSNRLKILMQRGRTHLGRQINQMFSRHTGAAGYILTRKAAERFLAQRPFTLTVDQLLFNFNASPAARAMKMYQVTPALIEQGNDPATQPLDYSNRLRPSGWPLYRQKLLRGYYELAYPFSTVIKLIRGKLHLEPIHFENSTIILQPQNAASD